MTTTQNHFIANDGTRLTYLSAGPPHLPPLILLHGFTGSSSVFHKNIPRLSAHYQIYIPDLRGHGSSSHTPHGHHVSRLAVDLANFLAHLNLTAEVSVIACSLGCAILWSYAELFGTEVWTRMVWVDQAPMQNYGLLKGDWGSEFGNRSMNCEAAVKGLMLALKDDPESVYRGTAESCLGYLAYPRPEDNISEEEREKDISFFVGEAKKGDAEWYGLLMADHTARDWRRTIRECFGSKKCKTRVLVIASSRSGCFLPEGVLAAVEMINGKNAKGEGRAEGTCVEWGGHWCYWEDAERFDSLVLEFLGRE